MREAELAVVGAGPAGVAAALAASRLGAGVTLIDEQTYPGGHLRWTIAEQPDLTGELAGKRGFEVAAWAAREVAALGVNYVAGVAWGLFEGNVLGVVAGDGTYQLRCQRLILATGSTDITQPFPGWELPGVMTERAALRSLHEFRVLPGRRAVVIGAGPVGDDLALAGVEVVARVDAAAALEAGGDGLVEWVETGGQRVEADCVVIALGRQPDPELALQALCESGFSTLDGAFVPLRDDRLATSVPGVYVVGDAAGICSTAEAMAEGQVAAEAALDAAGLVDTLEALARLRSPERRAAVERLRLPAPIGS